jgi:hypothetical protein
MFAGDDFAEIARERDLRASAQDALVAMSAERDAANAMAGLWRARAGMLAVVLAAQFGGWLVLLGYWLGH